MHFDIDLWGAAGRLTMKQALAINCRHRKEGSKYIFVLHSAATGKFRSISALKSIHIRLLISLKQ